MKVIFTITLVCVLTSCVLCDHWALLVAGAKGWHNYGIQADICHAYHIMRNHGIPEERIVLMMYDDIAYNPKNPFPGEIINSPNGPNLYPGVLKDYTGHNVNPDMFLKVLTGDEEGVKRLLGRKGKVIKSGPDDNVFVYYVDHGAPGLIGFPEKLLTAKRLNDAILQMYENKQFKKMVFYLEACYSGSMFDQILRSDINVYATTATNPHEPGYFCYYDKRRGVFLGTLYGVNWMHDSDVGNLSVETLLEQYQHVKKETNKSHVMQYGELSIENQPVGAFQSGILALKDRQHNENFVNPTIDAISSENVQMEILRRRVESASGLEKLQFLKALETLKKMNAETQAFFQQIVNNASQSEDYFKLIRTKVHFSDFTCYSKSVDIIETYCPGMNLPQNYQALRNLRALANLCETDVPMVRIWSVVGDVARKSPLCNLSNPVD